MRTKGSAAELEARRRRAAEYFQAWKSLRTVAGLLGVHPSSVKRWKKAWKSGGGEALAAKPHPGGTSKLSEQQKQALVEILVAGPLAAGYRTDDSGKQRPQQLQTCEFGTFSSSTGNKPSRESVLAGFFAVSLSL